ncbi:MAG: glycosyltransferase family 4 protein [Candidatus Doudnabacteria bacterium]
MKIAVVAALEESIPPLKYGGTELVIYNVVQQLVLMGHDVTLLASGDSMTKAKLIPIFPKPLRSISELKDPKLRDAYKYMGTGEILSYLYKSKFDIVHNHLGWRLLPFAKIIPCPIVTTLHGPLDVPYQQVVYSKYKEANYVSISLSQRKPMPELNFVGNVYNGIDMAKFKFFPEPKDYFAFLGRMSPEKGPVQAIEIAKLSGVKLIMAAKVDSVDQIYFDKNVKHLIDGEQIKFIGEVDHAGKLELLGNARALIAPIQWEEPFGLFFTEAMACGTPVITMKRGSTPEIIVDGKTGYLCNNVDEAVAAVKKIDKINRKDCFDHVQINFSTQKMSADYVKVYEKVLAK